MIKCPEQKKLNGERAYLAWVVVHRGRSLKELVTFCPQSEEQKYMPVLSQTALHHTAWSPARMQDEPSQINYSPR